MNITNPSMLGSLNDFSHAYDVHAIDSCPLNMHILYSEPSIFNGDSALLVIQTLAFLVERGKKSDTDCISSIYIYKNVTASLTASSSGP
jgi:hypothetical protein